eukprot:873217-Amphidinium_carterae.1
MAQDLPFVCSRQRSSQAGTFTSRAIQAAAASAECVHPLLGHSFCQPLTADTRSWLGFNRKHQSWLQKGEKLQGWHSTDTVQILRVFAQQ